MISLRTLEPGFTEDFIELFVSSSIITLRNLRVFFWLPPVKKSLHSTGYFMNPFLQLFLRFIYIEQNLLMSSGNASSEVFLNFRVFLQDRVGGL